MSTISASTTSTTAYKVTADTTGTLVLQTGASPTTAVTIDGSQNVGIGTSSPIGRLDVNGSARMTSDVRTPNAYVYSSAGNYCGFAFYSEVELTTRQAVLETQTGTATTLKTDVATPLIFGTNATERMRIDSSGNVKLSTAGTKILNSSGNPILQQTGSVLQVVSATLTTALSTTSTTYTDATGISVSITPTSATSKILVFVDMFMGTGNTTGMMWQLVRNSTAIDVATAGTQPGTGGYYTESGAAAANSWNGAGTNFLDSPATTSATTYKVQFRSATGTTVYINRRAAGADFQGTSSITVMEIAA